LNISVRWCCRISSIGRQNCRSTLSRFCYRYGARYSRWCT